MNDKNKEMDRTLRQISRSYEDRCKQRLKMKSTLTLAKEIPKMEFDSNNKLVARDDFAKLENVKKGKTENAVKLDEMEVEVTDDLMSEIYHKALKDMNGKKAPKSRNKERRRSKTKIPERSCDSSSDTEIADIMMKDIFRQKVSEVPAEENKELKLKSLFRYSPKFKNSLFVVEENQKSQKKAGQEKPVNGYGSDIALKKEIKKDDSDCQVPKVSEAKCTRRPNKSPNIQIKEFKFLSIDEPVPSPAPEMNNITIITPLCSKEKKKAQQTLLKIDGFRKTKSSFEFENIPLNQDILKQKRNNSDPSSTFEEGSSQQDLRNKELDSKIYMNISKTAKKHLGMAVTPMEQTGNFEENDENDGLTLGNKQSVDSSNLEYSERSLDKCTEKTNDKYTLENSLSLEKVV